MTTAVSTELSSIHTDSPQPVDESDLRQICLLVSRGCTIKEAVHCIGCKLSTIRHERETNESFRRKLARAKMKANLAPIRAMQRAMLKDWRAAAWFLERTQPENFARRNHRAITQKQVNALVKDITSIVSEEVASKSLFDRLSSRIEAAVRYACHAHNDMNRTAAELDRAMKHHDMKSPRYSPTLGYFAGVSEPIPNPAPRSAPTAGGNDCRPNVIDNLTGVARPIVGAAQPKEANRAAVAQPPSPHRGAS